MKQKKKRLVVEEFTNNKTLFSYKILITKSFYTRNVKHMLPTSISLLLVLKCFLLFPKKFCIHIINFCFQK